MDCLPTYISTHLPTDIDRARLATPPSRPRFRGLHLINIAVCLALHFTDAMRCESTRLKRPDTRIIYIPTSTIKTILRCGRLARLVRHLS